MCRGPHICLHVYKNIDMRRQGMEKATPMFFHQLWKNWWLLWSKIFFCSEENHLKIHDTNAQHVSNIYYLLFFGEEGEASVTCCRCSWMMVSHPFILQHLIDRRYSVHGCDTLMVHLKMRWVHIQVPWEAYLPTGCSYELDLDWVVDVLAHYLRLNNLDLEIFLLD